MASTTPLFFTSSTQQQKTTQQPNQRPNTTTTTSKPDSNPKPRPRKGGKAKNGPTKTPQRGMGVERLEIERERLYGPSTNPNILASKLSSNNNNSTTSNIITNNNNNHFQQNYVTPLTGVPVHPYPVTLTQYYLPSQVGPSSIRAGPVALDAVELPSMPNLYLKEATHNIISYKKKRVNDEEEINTNEGGVLGFGKGKEKQHVVDYSDQTLQLPNNNVINYHHGVNFANNNGDDNYHHFPGYYDFTATDSQVMAIHKNWSGTNMMEYGFFPTKPDTDTDTAFEEENNKDYDNNKNYYYKTRMDYLDLKLGCSDTSYASSPSSSLTTVTTFTANASDTSLDLSLKLSTY